MLTRAGVSAWPFASAKRDFRVDQYSNKSEDGGGKFTAWTGTEPGLCENPSPAPAQARPGEEGMGGRGQVLPAVGNTWDIHSSRSVASAPPDA
jgi:hypothetical protein